MKVEFLDVLQGSPEASRINTTLTIVPFIGFLNRKIAEKNNPRSVYFEEALYVIKEIPDWGKEISKENIQQFEKAFKLIYFTFSPPVVNETNDAWAMAMPFSTKLFFGTQAFYNLLTSDGKTIRENLAGKDEISAPILEEKKAAYSLILTRLYNLHPIWSNKVVNSYLDEKTRLNKYFKLTFDNQFIDIKYKGELPKIDFSSEKLTKDLEEQNITELEKIIPLDKFSFEGFSIVHIRDITIDYALDHIKDLILNLKPGQKVYDDVAQSLKSSLGNPHIDIKLLPIPRINGKLAIDSFEDAEKYLDDHCTTYNLNKNQYLEALTDYSKNPQLIFRHADQPVQPEDSKLISLLCSRGMKSFGIIPILDHRSLLGILEIFSTKEGELSPQCLSVLTPSLPILKQLLQITIDDFELTIDNIIKKNFTPLQSAIQWRFNEAAYHFLQEKQKGGKSEIEHIYFTDVYPLYGAIDIRDSSKKRNLALQSDMYFRLSLLTDLFERLKDKTRMELINELMSKAYRWGSKILETITPEIELNLLIFLKNEAEPMLEHFRGTLPEIDKQIDAYFDAIKPGGAANANRDELEKSFQIVNVAISNNLDELSSRIQDTYPCYFEKFRSDGIEYDIYAGQSINPQKKFETIYLKDIRLQQLSSMVNITRELNALTPSLPKKLHTTQLIFIHSHPIDISFRADERRFDVEGAYNIRYEMVKKRIDKVHIKDSRERLTQPGKIALVYFQKKDIEEYLSYITYLQGKDLLEEKIEYLDLEYLQGVNGLKALRVAVKL